MQLRAVISTLALILIATASACSGEPNQASRWFSHVSELASDRYRGREAGTDGHRAAAMYVAAQFRALGADSLGLPGYLQQVPLISRRVDESASTIEIVSSSGAVPLALGTEVIVQKQFEPATSVEAPAVFVGYGLVASEAGHDDLAGLDLRGAIAVFLNGGGPAAIPEPLRSHVQSAGVRWKRFRDAGAIGWVSIPNPKVLDIPWNRIAQQRLKPSMSLAEETLDERAGQRFGITLHPGHADRLLAGSGHTMAEILSLADSSRALPRFRLPLRIRATVAHHARPVSSPNVVAALPGSDPTLRHECVVLTAHLDHLGVGTPVDGDSIWNGAMDNASGVATLLEIARAASRPENRPRRTLVFVATTAEEMGLLGSRYFAGRPPVPLERVVAVLNMDMTLPIVPLQRLIVFGLDESSLGDQAREVLAGLGIEAQEDPQPARNRFVRSDQYSFIARGVPSLAFTFGYHAGSSEESLLTGWVRSRYHAPSDDLAQPVDREAADRLTAALLTLTRSVADARQPPRWKATSFFTRFSEKRKGSRP